MLSEVERLQSLVDRMRGGAGGRLLSSAEVDFDQWVGELQTEIDGLREKMSRYQRDRELFSNGPVVLFRWKNAVDWPVEYVSPNVAELTGYPAPEFLSGTRAYGNLVHAEDLPGLVAATDAYSQRDVSWYAHRPYRLVRADGRVIWVANYEMAHRDETRAVTHFSGYIIEISEQIEQLARIREQESQIMQLSSPILKVARGVLALPVLGVVTSDRAARMTHDLLTAVVREKARAAILDLTGLGEVDTATLDHLLRMSRSVALLGCRCVLSGFSPEIAALAVRLGFDVSGLHAVGSLQDAIELVLKSK